MLNKEKTTTTLLQCLCCGNMYDGSLMEKVPTVNRGKYRYIHKEHIIVKAKKTSNVNEFHTDKKHGFTHSLELDLIPLGAENHGALCSELYGLIPTQTSAKATVNGAIKYKTPLYKSMNGIKSFMRTVISFTDINNPSLYHYITFSNTMIKKSDIDLIKQYSNELFNALEYEIQGNKNDTLNVFGCYFNDGARTHEKAQNGYCTKNAWLSLGDTDFTLRLAKINSVNQYFWLTNFCKELLDILYRNFIDFPFYDNEEKSLQAEKVSGKLVKLYIKYASGKALCQRPERNSKEV